ncbi:helix-turn-helix transcriptional regulator [Oryzihumus sp.]
MLLLLQTHERMTTRDLASRLEVSQRTVLRDVEALSAAGVPVHAERGRLGAIVLNRASRLNVSHLDPVEVQLLALTGLERAALDDLGFSKTARQTRQKLTAAIAKVDQPSRPLGEVLILDDTGWANPGHGTDLEGLFQAVNDSHRLAICYRRSGQTQPQDVVVDPYGLAHKSGHWYLVADAQRQPRLFALQRLSSYEALPEQAKLRAGQTLATVWQELLAQFTATTGVQIHAWLRTTRLDLAGRILTTRLKDVETISPEWARITVEYPDIESVRQLLQFGDHIHVIDPPEARTRVRHLAQALAANHTGVKPPVNVSGQHT